MHALRLRIGRAYISCAMCIALSLQLEWFCPGDGALSESALRECYEARA
jgi:hypothetical protein